MAHRSLHVRSQPLIPCRPYDTYAREGNAMIPTHPRLSKFIVAAISVPLGWRLATARAPNSAKDYYALAHENLRTFPVRFRGSFHADT